MAESQGEFIDPQLLGDMAQGSATQGSVPENGDMSVDEPAVGQEEDDDDDIVTSKRDKRREEDDDEDEEQDTQTQSQKSKKKKRRSVEPEEENEGQEGREESEQDRRRREMLKKIDAAAKGPKKAKRKKADETDLDQVADDEVAKMRDMMMQAANEDQDANVDKRPATAKLRMLKDAVELLQKTGYQQAILDNNLLEAVRMWLEPLPDKSLPSLNIQKAMFPLLDRIYIDSTSLKMSGLGKLVLFYTRCDRVDKGIARIADRLIESWSRPILKRSSSYRDRQQARKEYQVDPTRMMQRAAKGSQVISQPSSQRARIPESVTGNAFKYAPITSVSDHPDETRYNSQKINKFKRSMQAAAKQR